MGSAFVIVLAVVVGVFALIFMAGMVYAITGAFLTAAMDLVRVKTATPKLSSKIAARQKTVPKMAYPQVLSGFAPLAPPPISIPVPVVPAGPTCVQCAKPVQAGQEYVKSMDGEYLHKACLGKVSYKGKP